MIIKKSKAAVNKRRDIKNILFISILIMDFKENPLKVA